MKLAMIGLGKMGGNMTKRLVAAGHQVVAHDINSEASKEAEVNGAFIATDRLSLIDQLQNIIIWLMSPSGHPHGCV